MITSKQLVDYAQRMLDIGAAYWYGTFGQQASTSLYNAKRAQYSGHYTSSRVASYKADIAAGKLVVDCIGLIKGAAWSNGGMYPPAYCTNGCPDQSADGMFSWCKSKGMEQGKMANLPEVPGLLLHMKQHAGVYIGNGWAIEAKGFADDVVKSKVAGRGWTGWSYLPFVDYSEQIVPPDLPVDAGDVVVTGGSVNVRALPGTDAAIRGVVEKGERFPYAGQTSADGWHLIVFKGQLEWISGKFSELVRHEQPVPPPAREPVIVDLSQHSSLKDKRNDWAEIARNVDLLILRCGVTRTETAPLGIGIDDEFAYAAKKCAEHGIPFGVYFYGKVKTVAEARREADMAWDTASPYNPLFYCYDVEEGRLTSSGIRAWADQMRKRGAKRVGMYIGHNYYEKFKAVVSAFDFIWIPRYGKNDGKYNPKYDPAFPCDIHQFTSVGKVPGFYDKTLDINRLTGSKPLDWFLKRV